MAAVAGLAQAAEAPQLRIGDPAPRLSGVEWLRGEPQLDWPGNLSWALHLAGRSVGLSERPNADYLELLARVHALRGEHGKAILHQRQAIAARCRGTHE